MVNGFGNLAIMLDPDAVVQADPQERFPLSWIIASCPVCDLANLCALRTSPFSSIYKPYNNYPIIAELRFWFNASSSFLNVFKRFIEVYQMLVYIAANPWKLEFVIVVGVGSLNTDVINKWHSHFWK